MRSRERAKYQTQGPTNIGTTYKRSTRSYKRIIREERTKSMRRSFKNPPNDNTIRGSWLKGWNKQEATFYRPSKSYRIGLTDIYKTMSPKLFRPQQDKYHKG